MTNNSHANDLTLETATELGRPVYVAINRGTSMKTLDKGCQVEEITFDGNGTINGVEFTEQGLIICSDQTRWLNTQPW